MLGKCPQPAVQEESDLEEEWSSEAMHPDKVRLDSTKASQSLLRGVSTTIILQLALLFFCLLFVFKTCYRNLPLDRTDSLKDCVFFSLPGTGFCFGLPGAACRIFWAPPLQNIQPARHSQRQISSFRGKRSSRQPGSSTLSASLDNCGHWYDMWHGASPKVLQAF